MENFPPQTEANIIDSPPSWLVRNKAPVIATTLLLLAAAIGTATWQARRIARENSAASALERATTPEGKLAIAHHYLGTQAAALALLTTAAQQYDAKDYTGCAATYALLLGHYPTHDLANSARLGLASAYEAAGRLDEALNAYLAVAGHNPPDNYSPIGMLEAARLSKARRDYRQARQLLSDCMRDYKNSYYGAQASQELESLPESSPPPPSS